MTALINIFFPNFSPAPTIENQVVAPTPTRPITDLKAYDRTLQATLKRGSERIAAAQSAPRFGR